MLTATIGAWAVSIPDDWELGDAQDKGSYIEAPDGTKGVYVYALAAIPPGTSAATFASQVQRSTIDSYSVLENSSWSVVCERNGNLAGCYVSVADVQDRAAHYCIRFIVVCGSFEGLRLALHDYFCESYEEARCFFDSVERSINLDSSAA